MTINAVSANSMLPSGPSSGKCGGSCGGGGGGGNGGGGGSGSGCGPGPCGMARWEVSEPEINIWLYDEPLGYQPALGPRMSFKLSFKQRDTDATIENVRNVNPNFFNVGTNWNCSWLSYIYQNGWSQSQGETFIRLPGGGFRQYDFGCPEQFTGSYLTVPSYDTNGFSQYLITYPDGSKDYYFFTPLELPSEDNGGFYAALLTARVDRFNHTNSFIYLETNGMVFLKYVVDADGKTNTLSYNTSSAFPTEITGVTDPFGHTASLKYDKNGVLTNITDEVNLNSGFTYDDQYWLTTLNTSYGQTTFEDFSANEIPAGYNADYWPLRAVRVVNAIGGTNVYMVRIDCSYVTVDTNSTVPYIIDGTTYANVIPTIPTSVNCENSPGVNCFNEQYAVQNSVSYRNSFHWGPKQAVNLPRDILAYTPADLNKGRMRHWRHNTIGGFFGSSLIMEQSPSPDGTSMGQTVWYDHYYDAQDENFDLGLQDTLPSLAAKLLPDGTTAFTWFARDWAGHATNVVDTYSSGYGATPLMRTNIYVYDANDVNLIQHIGPLGDTEGWAYNANNQVLFYTNAQKEITSYTYDSQARLTSVTTPAGLVTTNIYYTSGPNVNFLQTSIDLQIQRTNSYTYTNDVVYTHTDERGLATTNNWDALNRLAKVSYPDGFITNSYHWLDLAQTVDRMGFGTTNVYDGERHLIAVTNALGYATHYNYCPCGALDSMVDALGNVTWFTYDNAGDRLSVTYPDLYSISYNYDLLGRVTNMIDSLGVSVTNWFNNQGLKYAVSNAVGLVSLLAFDAENRVTNSTDANHVSIGITNDFLGRVLARTYPDKGVELFGYSFGISGPTSYTNQIGNVTRYVYDAALRKVAETNALNYVMRFTNSPAGDLLSLTDGKTDTTTWGYDSYGRVTNKVDAAGNLLFAYKYDPDSRLTNRWSAAKGSTTYAYDSVGNLKNVVYPVSPAITLSYDALNRLTTMVDAVGTTVYGLPREMAVHKAEFGGQIGQAWSV